MHFTRMEGRGTYSLHFCFLYLEQLICLKTTVMVFLSAIEVCGTHNVVQMMI